MGVRSCSYPWLYPKQGYNCPGEGVAPPQMDERNIARELAKYRVEPQLTLEERVAALEQKVDEY